MKKFTKILALAMVTVVASLALVACGPNSDSAKAAQNLKDNEYVVVSLTDVISLTATEVLLGCERGSLEAIVTGSKVNEDETVDYIQIYYFKDKSTANSVWEKAEANLKKDAEKETKSEVKVAKSGKMIYIATDAAIKATK